MFNHLFMEGQHSRCFHSEELSILRLLAHCWNDNTLLRSVHPVKSEKKNVYHLKKKITFDRILDFWPSTSRILHVEDPRGKRILERPESEGILGLRDPRTNCKGNVGLQFASSNFKFVAVRGDMCAPRPCLEGCVRLVIRSELSTRVPTARAGNLVCFLPGWASNLRVTFIRVTQRLPTRILGSCCYHGSWFTLSKRIPAFTPLKSNAGPGDHFELTTRVSMTISNHNFNCL